MSSLPTGKKEYKTYYSDYTYYAEYEMKAKRTSNTVSVIDEGSWYIKDNTLFEDGKVTLMINNEVETHYALASYSITEFSNDTLTIVSSEGKKRIWERCSR